MSTQMKANVLVIDDEVVQASSLAKALAREIPDLAVDYASEEDEIKRKIICTNFSIAIVDMRMDDYDIDGAKIIDLISEINPYAKVIAVSAYSTEYQVLLSEYLSQGKLLAICEKEDFVTWLPRLKQIITDYLERDYNPIAVKYLLEEYTQAKNETDTYLKGVLFEKFVVNLFRQMGFYHIETRVKDKASNEIDLVVRNDVQDPLFSKYKRYIFVECKNKPDEGFSKNDFIVFNNKINSSHGDSDLGVVFTTGSIKRTVYLEALKESKFETKILYMSSSEILRLIHTPNMIEEFKNIMDEQVV